MKQLETTGYYAFGVPLYLSMIGIEWLRARRGGAQTLSLADSIGNLGAGLGSIVVGLFLGPLLVALYDWAYSNFALVHWDRISGLAWAPWLLAIVLADFGHYWHHRLDHRVAVCWAVHGVHHQPQEMNFTVAMRHAWFSDLYSFPFYAPLPLLGVPTSYFFIATTLLSFHALITHTEHFNFPGLGILVTPRSHILHHAKNPRYIDKNFGAMLCIWDRIFGTHVELSPDEPPRYGALHGYETHDGALAQWVLWRDLRQRLRRARTFRDKLRVLFRKPGWLPPGVELPPPQSPPPSATLPLATKLYVLVQFAATLALALPIFILRDVHSWQVKTVGALFLLASLLALGGILDRRRAAWRWELSRVAAAVLLLALLLRSP